MSNTLQKIIKMSQSGGNMMKCPFDEAHVMPADSFFNHLAKCKLAKKEPHRKCKYNSYHVFRLNEIEHHEKKCEDRFKYKQEESDDDWGAEFEEQREQKEKSEVSTVAASNYSKPSSSSGWVQTPVKAKKPIARQQVLCEDFDAINFSSRK